ncbi:MAG: c-type cytochrome [Arenicellales bacterium]|jgi:cytochrome c553
MARKFYTVALMLLGMQLSTQAAAQAGVSAATCMSCHGAQGLPLGPTIPVIQGQHFYYLYVQLKDYNSGLRANPIMSAMAADLSRDDMKALSQMFSEAVWPNMGFSASEDQVSAGEKALVAGQCVQCHRGGFEGDSRVPRLAGQQVEYLEKTMQDFKNKIRLNSPAKGALLGAYSDEEIRAMAEYLADL